MCELVFQQEECKIKSGKAENTSRFNHHKASKAMMRQLSPASPDLANSNIFLRVIAHPKEPHYQGPSQ